MENHTRINPSLTSPARRDPEEPAPRLPMSLCSHIASRHDHYEWFAPGRFLPQSTPDYRGTPQETRLVVTGAQTWHLFEHAKGKNPDHDHTGDEWWAFGKMAR